MHNSLKPVRYTHFSKRRSCFGVLYTINDINRISVYLSFLNPNTIYTESLGDVLVTKESKNVRIYLDITCTSSIFSGN